MEKVENGSLDNIGPRSSLDFNSVYSPDSFRFRSKPNRIPSFPDPRAPIVHNETDDRPSGSLHSIESPSTLKCAPNFPSPFGSLSLNSSPLGLANNPRLTYDFSRPSSMDSRSSRGSASTLVAEHDDADTFPISLHQAPGSSLTWSVVNNSRTHSHLPSATQVNLKRGGEYISQLPSSAKRYKGSAMENGLRSLDPADLTQDTSDGSTLLSQVPGQTSAAHAIRLIDQIEVMKTILHNIFKTVELYKRLLSVRGVDAQKILDGFQLLLDNDLFPDRAQVIAAMGRLSNQTQLYPSRFFLEGPSPTAAAEPVASGSFADIYRVISRGEELCYKVIRVYQNSQVEHIAKVYAREAILWGQLSHRNILPFYGLIKFRFGLRISFVSRWASNGNLEDYLIKHPEANRLLLCSDTAAGVEYLHKNDIVHGDLKGSNVLIDSSGRACLGDFGVSSVADSDILNWTSQSTVASQGGTVRFQAPELLGPEDTTKKAHNSKASDVFAWANICYETFTGCLPFHEVRNPATIVLNITQGKIPTRPKDTDAAWTEHGLSSSMWELIEDCWNFEPSKRPDMTSVILRLDPEQLVDLRPSGEWTKTSMRFRNAQDNVSKDLLPSLKELESLLSSIVFRIEKEEH